jgi:DNA-binding MarR family transcriptional regulator
MYHVLMPEPERRAATVTGPSDVAVGLAQLSRLVECVMARVAGGLDLTPVQARLLCTLGFGPRVMSDLARCLGVEKAGLTGLVDRAERRGLVQRTPVPGDRRAFQITLTDAGRRAGEAFHTQVTAALDELVAPLSPRVHQQFGRALTEILTAASRGAFDHCMTALPELNERNTG